MPAAWGLSRLSVIIVVILFAVAATSCGADDLSEESESQALSIADAADVTDDEQQNDGAQPTASPTASPSATPTTTEPEPEPTVEEPVVTTKLKKVRKKIAFRTKHRRTNSLARGKKQVSQTGARGVRVITFRVTRVDGQFESRERVRARVARKPRPKIVLHGTYVAPKPTRSCDPNYSGCVPIASDVDCAGGSGNGPKYVSGPVRVTGSDIYGLDSDDDGYGCE